MSPCRYNVQRPGQINLNSTIQSRSAVSLSLSLSPSCLSTWQTLNAVLPSVEPHGYRNAPVNWVRLSNHLHSWLNPSLNYSFRTVLLVHRVSSYVLPLAKRLVSERFHSHVNMTDSNSHCCNITIYSVSRL